MVGHSAWAWGGKGSGQEAGSGGRARSHSSAGDFLPPVACDLHTSFFLVLGPAPGGLTRSWEQCSHCPKEPASPPPPAWDRLPEHGRLSLQEPTMPFSERPTCPSLGLPATLTSPWPQALALPAGAWSGLAKPFWSPWSHSTSQAPKETH